MSHPEISPIDTPRTHEENVVCEQTFTPEQQRNHAVDDPCDDGRSG